MRNYNPNAIRSENVTKHKQLRQDDMSSILVNQFHNLQKAPIAHRKFNSDMKPDYRESHFNTNGIESRSIIENRQDNLDASICRIKDKIRRFRSNTNNDHYVNENSNDDGILN